MKIEIKPDAPLQHGSNSLFSEGGDKECCD